MEGKPYSDDPTIANGSILWRRIYPGWAIHDENSGKLRVSSAAFDDSKDGTPTSVLLADIVILSGREARSVLAGFPEYGLAALSADQVRNCGNGVARDPLPEEPAHGLITGRKTKKAKQCLQRAADWVIRPLE